MSSLNHHSSLSSSPNDSNTNSNAFKSSFLALFLCPWSFAVLVARKRSRLFNRLPRLDALDCDEFSIDLALCNAENTRFPRELEVLGQDVSELGVCSYKIFFTSSEASPRQDYNFERDERSISVLTTTRCFSKWQAMKANENSMMTGEESFSVNRCAINR